MNYSEENVPVSSKIYPQDLITFEQYLVLEDEAEYKSEFEQGKVIEMSGGTYRHSRIATNISYAIQDALRNKKSTCQVTDSNLKVYVEALNSSVYPDLMVLCESPQFWKERTDIITNPFVIVEVLSKSTENYDRGQKFRKYRALPSFKEYILVSQNETEVEAWSLRKDGAWVIKTHTSIQNQMIIPALDIDISLEDIYYQIDFTGPA